ncbi:MAG: T9SS type A sorting domain-containing protein [Candidatus Cloacimonadota bacterium]|nr:T9SS type A sorting domain-containing protein [Candidatus Cloacimonadota bacterium]
MKILISSLVMIIIVTNLICVSKVTGELGQNSGFGWSTAMSGDWMIVGEKWGEGRNSTYGGTAYIFKRIDNSWNTGWLRNSEISPSNGVNNKHFGVAVDIDEDHAIVGADYHHKAYIYARSGDDWSPITETELFPTDGGGNYFGKTVAIYGDYAVVGENWTKAYLFKKDEGGDNNWGQLKAFDEADSYYSAGLAIENSTLLIGAPGANKVFIYDRDEDGADNWGQVQVLTNPDVAPGDDFGYDVAIQGNTAVVGAKDGHRFYVFEESEGVWDEVANFATPFAGASVDIDYPNIVVGGAPDTGNQKAYHYKKNSSGVWGLIEELVPIGTTTQFSSDVAISGNQIAVCDDWSEENPYNGDDGEGCTYIFPTEHTFGGDPFATFRIENMEAGSDLADFMFSQGGDPYVPNGTGYNNVYAYETMQWGLIEGNGRHATTATLLREDATVFVGLNAQLLEINIDAFDLSSFSHINTSDINLDWNNIPSYSAGDNRYYDGGTGYIKYDGTKKLDWENMILNLTVPYPYEQANGNNRIGTGAAIYGYGQADLILENCDEGWLAEFDPENTGQLLFKIESFSQVHQTLYGYYTADISIVPVEWVQEYITQNVPSEGVGLDLDIPFENAGIDFNFDEVAFGEGADGNDLVVHLMEVNPGGTLPGAIQSIANQYWHFGTTLESFQTDITFNLSDLGNLGDTANLRILRRVNDEDDWEIWSNYVLDDGTHLRATGVTGFSDWTVASEEDQTLPVELSSFTAVVTADNYAKLNWTTQSETDLSGYNVYRNDAMNSDSSVKINSSIISGNNSSVGADYEYIDEFINAVGMQYYWLESVDLDGTTELFGPVLLNFVGNVLSVQNYELNSINHQDINISWEVSNLDEDVRYFDIYRNSTIYFEDSEKLNSEEIFIEDGQNGLYQFVDESADLGTNYFYWVTANSWNEILKIFQPINFRLEYTDISEFSATTNSQEILVDWKTDFEIEMSSFQIYKSISPIFNNTEIVETIVAENNIHNNFYTFTDLAIEQGATYYYWIKGVTANRNEYLSDMQKVEVPFANILIGNYPNPFNPTTTIRFSVENPQNTTLEIFNIMGQKVRSFEINQKGEQEVVWNGKDNAGKKVSSGVYFINLNSSTSNDVQKVLLLK